jgi:pyrroline-5-carboxylate reductase
MDAATVLAASGTAFALRYIRASMQAGIEIGFDWKTALAISAQTVKEQPRWSWKNKYIQNN